MAQPFTDDGPTRSELIDCLEEMRPRICQRLQANRIPPTDSEDLVQDICLAFLQQRRHGDPIHCIEAWLFATLLFKIRTYWRDRGRERDLHATIAQQPTPPEPLPQERVGSACDSRNLTAGIPPRDLQLLWFRYGIELDNDEAALQLACRPGSVPQLTRRALLRTRQWVARTTGPST